MAKPPSLTSQCKLGLIWLLTLVSGAYASDGDECITNFDQSADYFSIKAKVEYARGFTVTYHNSYKVLTVQDPSGGKDSVVLLQCGAPPPVLEGELARATIIPIPARTLGANEDLSLNRARVLGYSEHVIAMGGGGIFAPSLRDRWESGDAVSIGESFHGQPDYEKLLDAAPDVVFLSTASLARAQSIQRARILGLPAVPSMSWVESSVLGQAEWLQVVAIFLNEEETANAILDEIKTRYTNLSALARAQSTAPTVVWFDPAQQRNQWIVPEASWLAELIDDAGGRSPWADTTGGPERTVTTEQILTVPDAIDAFITTTVALGEPGSLGVLEDSPALKQGRLFDVHKRSRPEHNAYDWYESAIVEVDRVLEDFIALLHPHLVPDHSFRYLRPLRTDDAAQ